MVGYVADAELSPKTRIAVRRIMRTDSLASIANRMDEARSTKEGWSMRRWHFVTMKACGEAQPSCKNGNCATGRIEWARDELRTAAPEDALNALEVLVHLVGDLHQPLHAADNSDFGGNGVTVTNRTCLEFGASRPSACRLHTYWDTNLVKAASRGLDERDAAAAWSTELGPLPTSDPVNAEDWAMESNGLARRVAFGFDGFVCKGKHLAFAATKEYDTAATGVVQQQIAKAGKRLAKVLNEIFD